MVWRLLASGMIGDEQPVPYKYGVMTSSFLPEKNIEVACFGGTLRRLYDHGHLEMHYTSLIEGSFYFLRWEIGNVTGPVVIWRTRACGMFDIYRHRSKLLQT
ncbi:hypothetical protein D3C71_1934740 [compost metagenome]